jgi:hypothetical protein
MRAHLAGLGFGTLAAVAACGDFGPGDEIAVWECVSANGHAVPGTVPVYVGLQTAGLTIVYERFRLEGDGLCTMAYSYADPINMQGVADSTADCSYAVQFDVGTITITVNDSPLHGSIGGGSMTLVSPNEGGPDNVSEYRKRYRGVSEAPQRHDKRRAASRRPVVVLEAPTDVTAAYEPATASVERRSRVGPTATGGAGSYLATGSS